MHEYDGQLKDKTNLKNMKKNREIKILAFMQN